MTRGSSTSDPLLRREERPAGATPVEPQPASVMGRSSLAATPDQHQGEQAEPTRQEKR